MQVTYQDIADELKEIVVEQYAKEPSKRDWYAKLGELIDNLEALQSKAPRA